MYAFRLILAMGLGLLVSAGGQIERESPESPARLNGNQLQKAKARASGPNDSTV